MSLMTSILIVPIGVFEDGLECYYSLCVQGNHNCVILPLPPLHTGVGGSFVCGWCVACRVYWYHLSANYLVQPICQLPGTTYLPIIWYNLSANYLVQPICQLSGTTYLPITWYNLSANYLVQPICQLSGPICLLPGTTYSSYRHVCIHPTIGKFSCDVSNQMFFR